MKLITLVFKSGATIQFKATEFELVREGEERLKLEWKSSPLPEDRRLRYVDLKELVAATSEDV